MNKQTLCLIFTLPALAAAQTLPLADSFEIPKERPALYAIGRSSTTTAPLTLTLSPSGGAIVARVPTGAKVGVLLVDQDGRQLLRNAFGLTGWAQTNANGDDDDFPALAQRPSTAKGEPAPLTLNYLPTLGQPEDGRRYWLSGSRQTDAPRPGARAYQRLLTSALRPAGPRYHFDCHSGLGAHCLLRLADTAATAAPRLSGRDFYLPGDGFVYVISNAAPFPLRQKWTLTEQGFSEVPQPYYYLGLDSVYHGRRSDRPNGEALPLALTRNPDGGKAVAELKPGDSLQLLLLDRSQPCPAEADRPEGCAEVVLLAKTARGQFGWLRFNGLAPTAPRLDLASAPAARR